MTLTASCGQGGGSLQGMQKNGAVSALGSRCPRSRRVIFIRTSRYTAATARRRAQQALVYILGGWGVRQKSAEPDLNW